MMGSSSPRLPPLSMVPSVTRPSMPISVEVSTQAQPSVQRYSQPAVHPTQAFVQNTVQTVTASEPTGGSCIICVEDFNTTTVRRPAWISLACLHEPSTCIHCLAKCIKNDLEYKIWNQISCPECKAVLIYDDIKRLSDEETFSRYVLATSYRQNH